MKVQTASLFGHIVTGVRCGFRWLTALLVFLCKTLITIWFVLALYYSNLPWPWVRALLAIVFLTFSLWALWVKPCRQVLAYYSGACAFVMLWWCLISPSHERRWKPEVARMPCAVIDGDQLRITNFRNFTYRGNNDFDAHYEERIFDLADLKAVDFFISYWKPGVIGHTFLSFDFENDNPLCISIEIRPEVDESFSPLGSMFKQYELIYVAGEERDIVGVRVKHRQESVYLYRTRTSPANARALLTHYVARMNRLAAQPEFYNLLSNSCTINTLSHARASAGLEKQYDIRFLLNGLVDQVLYNEGIIDTTLPFEQLRKKSLINEEIISLDINDFSNVIRYGRPATRVSQ